MKILIVATCGVTAARIATAINNEGQGHRIALNVELPEDGTAPEWIQLLPAGQIITGRDGRTWINDHPELLVQAFAMEGKDLPVDWEHSSQIRAPNGEEAPAAGWIAEIQVRDDGSTWGRVAWTEKGKASVASREYRYISPVFRYDLDTNRILRFLSAGLTNQPNLYLDALNHEEQRKEHDRMNLAELLAALGLPASATFTDAMNRIATLKAEHQTALNQAQNPPLNLFVPRADHDLALNRATTAETELKRIRDEQLETAINTEIDAALKAGKITPATRDYHVAQCRQEGGLDRFKSFVAAAPVIADASGLDTKKPEGDLALNAEEAKVAAMFGNTAEDLKKYGSL